MAEPIFERFGSANYGAHQAEYERYLEAGAERAFSLGNRGPIRFAEDGTLALEILQAYARCGFYVFEGVLSEAELADHRADLAAMMARFPTHLGAQLDAQGAPALGSDRQAPTVQWTRPLSDPFGGTQKANGRHPAKMIEPDAPDGAPRHIVQLVLGSLQFSDAALRTYGHPDLLRVAEAINGPDFTPFNEAIWIKHPGLGGSVAWHQDATTHWDSPELDGDTHGFNFMAQLYGSTPANGLWVLPGSHLEGKVDIARLVAQAGSDRLPAAVPIVCNAGDVAICNRQAVHGSFANTSPDVRVTINFGFHKRASVLGAHGGGIHNEVEVYDEARIAQRSKMIAYAIDARRQRFPDEVPYTYAPVKQGLTWDEAARAAVKDYNLLDLGI